MAPGGRCSRGGARRACPAGLTIRIAIVDGVLAALAYADRPLIRDALRQTLAVAQTAKIVEVRGACWPLISTLPELINMAVFVSAASNVYGKVSKRNEVTTAFIIF